MRTRLITTAALGLGLGPGLGLAVLAAPASAASATPLPASCTVDGHTLDATADYVSDGAFHRWTFLTFVAGGPGPGDGGEVDIRVLEDGATAHRWSSAARPGVLHVVSLNGVRTRASAQEWVTFRARFPTPFPGATCTAATVRI